VSAAAVWCAAPLLPPPTLAADTTAGVAFPPAATSRAGLALAQLCDLQCVFADADGGAGAGRCAPPSRRPPRPSAAHLQRALHRLVDEAGPGRLGGATLSATGGRGSWPLPGAEARRLGRTRRLRPCRTDGVDGALLTQLVGTLTLYRNSLGGSMARAHDPLGLSVVAASALRLGVCLDATCAIAAAVDTTRAAPLLDAGAAAGGAGRAPPTTAVGTPILTHRDADGVARPVAVANTGLLTLGRAALASPSWFATATPPTAWAATLDAEVVLRADPPPVAADGGDPPPHRSRSWRLGGPVAAPPGASASAADAGALHWLDAVAATLCTPQRLLSNDAGLCDGSSRGEFPEPLRHGWPTALTTWSVVPPAPSLVADAAALPLPPWSPSSAQRVALADGSPAFAAAAREADVPREINPASVAEARLASALGQRLAVLPVPPVATAVNGTATTASAVLTGQRSVAAIQSASASRLTALAAAYDGRVFASTYDPGDALTRVDMLLAVLVLLPELFALLGMWWTAPVSRDGRHCGVFLLLYVGGVLSLAGVWALVWWEVRRADWTGSAEEWALHAVLPTDFDGAPNRTEGLAGTVVVLERTLLIGSVIFSWYAYVVRLAIGLSVAYCLLTTPLVVVGSVRFVRHRWRIRGARRGAGCGAKRGGGSTAGRGGEATAVDLYEGADDADRGAAVGGAGNRHGPDTWEPAGVQGAFGNAPTAWAAPPSAGGGTSVTKDL